MPCVMHFWESIVKTLRCPNLSRHFEVPAEGYTAKCVRYYGNASLDDDGLVIYTNRDICAGSPTNVIPGSENISLGPGDVTLSSTMTGHVLRTSRRSNRSYSSLQDTPKILIPELEEQVRTYFKVW